MAEKKSTIQEINKARTAKKKPPLDPKATLIWPTCPQCKQTIETVCIVGASCPKCKSRLLA